MEFDTPPRVGTAFSCADPAAASRPAGEKVDLLRRLNPEDTPVKSVVEFDTRPRAGTAFSCADLAVACNPVGEKVALLGD